MLCEDEKRGLVYCKNVKKIIIQCTLCEIADRHFVILVVVAHRSTSESPHGVPSKMNCDDSGEKS